MFYQELFYFSNLFNRGVVLTRALGVKNHHSLAIVLHTLDSSFDTTILRDSAGDGGVRLVGFSVVAA